MSSKHGRTGVWILAVGLMVLSGCRMEEQVAWGEEASASATPLAEMVVRTRDYAFDAPSRVPSGPTRIRLVNDGPDFHHVWLIKLQAGRTVEELVDSLKRRPVAPEWAVDVGGPNTPGMPGEATSAVLDLEPGSYALVCLIPGPDGELHIMKDMARALTVDASEREGALPEADVVMTMADYAFGLSDPIQAGRQTIRVENVAEEAHELVVVRLQDGKRAEDFLAFVQSREGTPPGKIIGGVTGIAKGGVNVVTLDFEPGTYAFLCFVHDATDGRPHVMHGMAQTFQVT